MDSKTLLREHFKKERLLYLKGLNSNDRMLITQKFDQHLEEILSTINFNIISGYIAKEGEVDLTFTLERLHEKGKRLALPYLDPLNASLEFKKWAPGEQIEMSAFKVFQPSKESINVTPDVMLIPMLAFDDQGHRLGYGKGHFDRALTSLHSYHRVITIGVAFSLQHLNHLPSEPHDVSLNFIVTEKSIHRF